MGNLNVEQLLLSHNKLKALPPTVVCDDFMRFSWKIFLEIYEIFPLFNQGLLQNMVLLDLTANRLTRLPPELGELVYCLKQIKLAENPLAAPLPE